MSLVELFVSLCEPNHHLKHPCYGWNKILSFKQPVINELSEGGLLVFLKSSLHQPFCFLEPCIVLMSFCPSLSTHGNDDTDGVKFNGTVLGARLSVFHVLTRMILRSICVAWCCELRDRMEYGNRSQKGPSHRLLSLFYCPPELDAGTQLVAHSSPCLSKETCV